MAVRGTGGGPAESLPDFANPNAVTTLGVSLANPFLDFALPVGNRRTLLGLSAHKFSSMSFRDDASVETVPPCRRSRRHTAYSSSVMLCWASPR